MTQAFVFEQLEPTGEVLAAGATPADRAAEILAQAEARAERVLEEAREAGFAAGREEGIAAAERELQSSRDLLAAAVDAVYAARDEFVAAAEREAVELALAIAGKIVPAALAADPQRVCELVAGALRRATDPHGLVLELNPDDVEIVRAWIDGGGAAVAGRIDLMPERRVERGGCVVRTVEGEIDARPSEQLARAEEVLREALGPRGGA